MLTNGTDNLTGTSNDDTFIGDNVSTGAGDTIVGGAGNDTLKLFATSTSPNYSGIETVYYNAPAGNINVSAKSDVTSVELDSEAGSRSITVTTGQAVKLSNLTTAGQTTTVAGNTPTTVNVTTNAFGTTANAQILALTGTSVTALNLTSATAASNFSVTDAGGKLATITFAGDKATTLAHALTTVTSIDASTSTGGLNVSTVGASNLTFKGGSGNDRLNVVATLTAADNLDGGTGTDTIAIGDADTITALTTANVKGFEVLEVTTADATAYNVTLLGLTNNPLTGVTVSESGGAGTTINNINAASTGNIKFVGDTPTAITLTAADFVVGGTSDAATIVLDNSVNKNADGVDIATSFSFAGVDVLTVNSVSDGTPAAGEQNSIAAMTITDVEKLIVTGDQQVALTTAANGGTALTEVDASAMTRSFAFTANATAGTSNSVLVKGGSGSDAIDLSANGSTATVYLGAHSAATAETLKVDGGNGATASTAVFTATALASGDMTGGQIDVTFATVANADQFIINFNDTIEGLLKVGGTTLKAASANVTMTGQSFSNSTNVIASLNTVGGNNDVVYLDFDLNGDGTFTAGTDLRITITGLHTGAGGNDTLVYNAANDYFVFTAAT